MNEGTSRIPNCQEATQRPIYKTIRQPDLGSLWLWSLSFCQIPFSPQAPRPRGNSILHCNIKGFSWFGKVKRRGGALLREANQDQIGTFSLRHRRSLQREKLRAWGGAHQLFRAPPAQRSVQTHPRLAQPCVQAL